MSRPRKPVPLLKLQGTFQPCRHAEREKTEPRVEGDPGPPPEWLSPRACAAWEQITDAWRASKILSGLDSGQLATYCHMFARFVEGVIDPEREVSVAHIVAMSNVAHKLGLDPAGRARLSVPKSATPEAKPADPWAQIRQGLQQVKQSDGKAGRA